MKTTHASPSSRLAELIAGLRAPSSGTVTTLPACSGASDSVLLAALAARERDAQGMLVVVTAAATDAQRLHDEVAWLEPTLRTRLLPDWETLPWDHFSPHVNSLDA